MGDNSSQAESPKARKTALSEDAGPFTHNAVAGPSRPRRSKPSPPHSDDEPPRKRRRGRPPVSAHHERHVHKAHFENNEGIYWYHHDLKRHRTLSERYFNGVMARTAMQGGADLPLHATNEDDEDDFIADASWASDEKERFFAALTRHSRLRPDLIARDVGTKTEVDIWRYIWSLECQLPRVYERKGAMAEHRDWLDRMLWNGAYEVDDAVVDAEERLAPLVEQVEWSEAQSAMRAEPSTFPGLEGRAGRPISEANIAAIEAWGKELTVTKMDNVADVMYLDDFKAADDDDDEIDRNEDNEDKTEAETYARDDEIIASLRAIPKKERSSEQRSTLLTMENRRRIRRNYRRKQLRAQGKTDKEIDSAGGPDALWVGQHNAGRKRKSKAELLSESHPDVAKLRSLGGASYFGNRGWELFNFDRMPQLIELYQSAHGIKPLPHEPEAATSFEVLAPLYESLRNFVANLMRQASIVAALHDPTSNEVREEHVCAAIEDRSGYLDSTEALRPIWDRLTRLSAMAHERELAGSEEQLAAATRAEHGSQVELQGDGSRAEDGEADDEGDDNNDEAPKRRYGRRRLNPRGRRQPPRQLLFADPPSDEDVWMVEGTRTDEEDVKLDGALEEVDDALDDIMGVQVLGAAKSMEKNLVLDDHAWVNNMGIRGRKWKDHRAAVPVSQAAQGRLLRAQDAYHDLIEEITADRRKRREMAERTRRFPRKQRVIDAGHHRRYPPVPTHILAMESMMDGDSDNDRDVGDEEGAATASQRPRVLLSDDSENDASHADRKGAYNDSEDEEGEEWVASGSSSGALTTDEEDDVLFDEGADAPADEDAPSYEEDNAMPTTTTRHTKPPNSASKFTTPKTVKAPETPVNRESEAEDAEMDNDGEAGQDNVSMETAEPAILGGDDALDSDSEADVAPPGDSDVRDSDAEKVTDDEVNPEVEDEIDELDSGSEKDELESSPPPENGAFDPVVGDAFLASPLGGDDALDSDSQVQEEPKRSSPTWAVAVMSDNESTGLVGGDEALDSESEDELDANSDTGLVGGEEALAGESGDELGVDHSGSGSVGGDGVLDGESEDESEANASGSGLVGGDEALDSDSDVQPDDIAGGSVLVGGDEALDSDLEADFAAIADGAGLVVGDDALDSESDASIAYSQPTSARGSSPERPTILSPSPSQGSLATLPSSVPAPIRSLAISQSLRTRTPSPSGSEDSDADGYDSDLAHHTVPATREQSESESASEEDESDEDDAKLEVLQPFKADVSKYSHGSDGHGESVELLGGDDALDSDSD